MLLHRYNSIEFIWTLDADITLRLVKIAKIKERDNRIFRQWTALLPAMALTGSSISYEDYKDRVTGANIDFRPTLEVEREIAELEKLFQEGTNNGS